MRLNLLARWGMLLFITVFALFPFIWIVSVALSADPSGIWNFPQAFWPAEPGLFWFERVINEITLVRYLLNSLLMSVSTTFFILLLTIPCAYALVFLDFRGRQQLLVLFIITIMVPAELFLVPNFLTFSKIGLSDSYIAAVLPNIASAFGVFLMRQAFQDLPRDILDAARVDGAGEWRVLLTIALPLSKPMVATLAIFSFVLAWNDYLWPSVVLSSRIKMPVAVGIYSDLTGPFATSTSMVFAAVTLAVLPVLFLFVCGQKYFLSTPKSVLE